MNFLFPLGLWGLVGIPILIIIYIIKSKYAEQTVASTYLWTLSEKFLKRKRPVSPITGIISLILQILAVAAISLIIAHPIITIPDAAQEYCFVLDASGSMNVAEDGSTRFDRACLEIEKRIERATDGSRFTLVTVSDITTTVFEQTTEKKQALQLVGELKEGYTAPDFTDALSVAQKIFDENKGSKTIFFTDTAYKTVSNVEIVNVAKESENVAITGVNWSIFGGELTLTGMVHSYGKQGTVTISAYPDGAEQPLFSDELTLSVDESAPFELKGQLKSFASLKLIVSGADALELDNELILYDVKSEDTYSILLVSEKPFFIETVLGAVGHNKIKVLDPDDYTTDVSGYGLYIFDCCTPKELPGDGAVWFFDPQGSIPEAGFSVQGEVTLSRGDLIEKTNSTASAAVTMTENIEGDEIYLSEYVKCSLYRNFTTLFSYKGNPIIFAGSNVKGHREVVFAFDLHQSNLPMLVDFIILTENLMTFSFPDVVEKTDYYAGDVAKVNVIANCESIRVTTPSGAVTYLNIDAAIADVSLAEVGSYTVTVTVSGIPRDYYLFAALPEEERIPAPEGESFSLVGEAVEGGFDGTYDPLIPLFICLVIFFLCDWMVYCYEKYQLR